MIESSAWRTPLSDRESIPLSRKNCQSKRKFDDLRIWTAKVSSENGLSHLARVPIVRLFASGTRRAVAQTAEREGHRPRRLGDVIHAITSRRRGPVHRVVRRLLDY